MTDCSSARARHDAKVARIARALREHPRGRPVSFRKRAVSHQVPKRDDKRHTDTEIDISDLVEIARIDPATRTCTAEPGVTFADLVAATLPYGLVPAVVPELKTITLGGAVAGCSLESMSFKVGGFHDTCRAYEVVTAQGEILRCTPNGTNPLLFQMMHGTFGTLGALTELTFDLVPAKRYVHVVYERHHTYADYQAAIERHFRASDVDFMDGIIHAPDALVLSLGTFVDRAPYTHSYDWTRVYYRSTKQRREDYLRTEDYFFRYDRGVTNVHPKSFLGRLVLGKFVDSDVLLRLAARFRRLVLPRESPDVTVDLFLPFSRFGEFLSWHERTLGFFPLWCVPYRRVRDYEWASPRVFDGLKDELFVDLAIYGMKQPAGRNIYRELERELESVQGIKTLISYNYYDESEFWRTWNRPNYAAVKRVTDPDNILRDLFEKTVLAPRGLSRSTSWQL